MKNLKPYPENSFLFYKEVLTKKKTTQSDPLYKDRINNLHARIEKSFVNYDELFNVNTLPLLKSHGYITSEEEDLRKLYSYKSSVFQKFKIKITTTDANRIINTCQNCTISEINSFDHIVPQSEFAEFVIHPYNLLPSCTVCNSYKSHIWRQDNKNIFLNLYLDVLPSQQYLFVDITVKGDEIETSFYLDNRNGISSDLYKVIENHYKKLNLFERFSLNNDSVITPLVNSIETYRSKLSLQDIKDSAFDTSEKNKKAFGYNYWKSILEIELLSNNDFMKRFI